MPVLAAALPTVRASRARACGSSWPAPATPTRCAAGMDPEVARALEFLGAVSDADKASLLRSVDVYIAPNTGGESFGIILIEAMAAGRRPGQRHPRLRAGARRWEGRGTFRNEDPADLARQMVRAATRPEARAATAAAWACASRRVRLGCRGRRDHSWSTKRCGGRRGRVLGDRPVQRVIGRLRRAARVMPGDGG
jgi:phosphatidylinositol alpha-mannosyltransferase